MDGVGLVQTLGAIAGLLTAAGAAFGVILTHVGRRNTERAAESLARAADLRLLLDERKSDTASFRGDVDRLEQELNQSRERLETLREQHRAVQNDLWFARRRITVYAHQLVTAGLEPDRLPDLEQQ